MSLCKRIDANADVTTNYADMVRWVQAEPQFKSEAKTEFAQVADGWLVGMLKRIPST